MIEIPKNRVMENMPESFLSDKKGQKIGSDYFTIIDDPLIKAGLGSRLFDGDGFAAKKRLMIDSGVLKDFYIDWYYSRKLGWEPTTGGPSNLIIPPGMRSVKEIMKDLGRGIFISDFIGGNSNSTTGDASIGIIGQLFENGVPVQAVPGAAEAPGFLLLLGRHGADVSPGHRRHPNFGAAKSNIHPALDQYHSGIMLANKSH